MAAQIVSLVQHRAPPEPGVDGPCVGGCQGVTAYWPTPTAPSMQPAPCRHEWRGASGRLYSHLVYGLIECPPLPPAGYILVRRDAYGRRIPLRIGIASNEAPTLNLAEIRRRGALAGANEVHVRLEGTAAERRLVACDLRAGLLGTLAAAVDPEPAAGA